MLWWQRSDPVCTYFCCSKRSTAYFCTVLSANVSSASSRCASWMAPISSHQNTNEKLKTYHPIDARAETFRCGGTVLRLLFLLHISEICVTRKHTRKKPNKRLKNKKVNSGVEEKFAKEKTQPNTKWRQPTMKISLTSGLAPSASRSPRSWHISQNITSSSLLDEWPPNMFPGKMSTSQTRGQKNASNPPTHTSLSSTLHVPLDIPYRYNLVTVITMSHHRNFWS